MLTPDQLKEHRFERLPDGNYNAEEVNRFFGEVIAFYNQMFRENGELLRKITVLANKIVEYKNDENNIRDALLSAQRTADAVIRDARSEADTLLADAKEQALQIVENAHRETENIVSGRDGIVSRAEQTAAEILRGAEEQAQALLQKAEEEAVRYSASVNEDAQVFLTHTNTEAAEIISKTNEEAAEILDKANAEAAEILSKTNAEVESILQEAEAQAAEILREAEQKAQELNDYAEQKAHSTLEEMRRQLGLLMNGAADTGMVTDAAFEDADVDAEADEQSVAEAEVEAEAQADAEVEAEAEAQAFVAETPELAAEATAENEINAQLPDVVAFTVHADEAPVAPPIEVLDETLLAQDDIAPSAAFFDEGEMMEEEAFTTFENENDMSADAAPDEVEDMDARQAPVAEIAHSQAPEIPADRPQKSDLEIFAESRPERNFEIHIDDDDFSSFGDIDPVSDIAESISGKVDRIVSERREEAESGADAFSIDFSVFEQDNTERVREEEPAPEVIPLAGVMPFVQPQPHADEADNDDKPDEKRPRRKGLFGKRK